MKQLRSAFGLEIVVVDDGGFEIRWGTGVAVAQTDRPADLHGSHIGTDWTYVAIDDPDAHYQHALAAGADVLNVPHSTADGTQRGYSARDVEGNLWTFAVQRFGSD